MLLYKFIHRPTQKIYLGALKDSTRWDSYFSSSKIIKPMMENSPSEWDREILENFDSSWRWDEVVYLEQCLIKSFVKIFGWGRVFNKIANTGTASMFAPEIQEKIKESLAKPTVRKKMSDANVAFRETNPEAWLSIRKKAATTNRSSSRREDAKKKALDYYIANPDAAENLKVFWANWEDKNPEAVLLRREKINEVLRRSEHRIRAAQQVSNLWENPEYRAAQSSAHIGKNIAEKNGTFKGTIYGVKIDDPKFIITLNGTQDISMAGFSSKNVYACISGERKSHLGFLFTREELSEVNAAEYVARNAKGTRKRKPINQQKMISPPNYAQS
jgi:hypothetical protein